MDKEKLDRLITGKVPVTITEDEISSIAYVIGHLNSVLNGEKDEDWKNKLLKVISDLESIKEKYMSAKYN